MFIQIHTLTSYPASLLNRDDSGLAKRITFGDATRVRVSSQCLKRHWRNYFIDSGEFETALRSTNLFEKHVLPELVGKGIPKERARAALRLVIEKVIKGAADKKDKASLATAQPVLMGRAELAFLVERLAQALAGGDAVETALAELLGKESKKTLVELLGAERAAAAGVEAAMFGRFVTSDLLARTDSAVSVQHAMTVHGAAVEVDFFSVVDDLAGDAPGADHIGDSELSAGVFYNYVTVDVPGLVSNLMGVERAAWRTSDLTLSKAVIATLVNAVTTVSPGAKKGSTAPFARAEFLLLEFGTSQPRTLANAFLKALEMRRSDPIEAAVSALERYLVGQDAMYGRQEQRIQASGTHTLKAELAEGPMSVKAAAATLLDRVLARG